MVLAIITPSRGRPRNAVALVEALTVTTDGPWVLYLGLDDDDRHQRRYFSRLDGHPNVRIGSGPRRSLTQWTNQLARLAVTHGGAQWLASLGDDHLPRTAGWDTKLIESIQAMDGPGWAYGDDLLQGERIPTAWVQHADTMRALGWMALPQCEHLCIDSAVHDLGSAAGRITYRPDVVIEHMHPAIGKAREDDTYRAGNSDQRVAEDGAGYRAWRDNLLAQDAAKIRELRWSGPAKSQRSSGAPHRARSTGPSAPGASSPETATAPSAPTAKAPRPRKSTTSATPKTTKTPTSGASAPPATGTAPQGKPTKRGGRSQTRGASGRSLGTQA